MLKFHPWLYLSSTLLPTEISWPIFTDVHKRFHKTFWCIVIFVILNYLQMYFLFCCIVYALWNISKIMKQEPYFQLIQCIFIPTFDSSLMDVLNFFLLVDDQILILLKYLFIIFVGSLSFICCLSLIVMKVMQLQQLEVTVSRFRIILVQFHRINLQWLLNML